MVKNLLGDGFMYMRVFFFNGKYYDNYGREVKRSIIRNMVKSEMTVKIIEVEE